MAEITGPFRFKGSMGNLRVYWNSAAKKWLVAGKGGANKNLIYNSPVFARTRENMSEFKACGNLCHLFRMGLFDLDHLNWGYYMSDVVKVVKVIQSLDMTGLRGHRNIEPSKHKVLLTDINFNEQHPFKQIVLRRPEVISDDERKDVILNFPQFVSWYELGWKKKNTFFRFSLSIAQLSDYVFDESDQTYGPAYPDIEARHYTVFTDWMMHRTDPVDISLTASFPENEIPPSDATVLVALGVEFATALSGGSISSAKGDGTMALIACL